MPYSEIVKEALSGWQDYKQALLKVHDGYTGAIDVDEIRSRLAAEGVVTHSPLLTIPYTTEGLEKVTGLVVTHPWVDSFAAEHFDKALAIRRRRDTGETMYAAGYPTPFYTNLLDVAVDFDETELNAADFGRTYAFGSCISSTAHEIVHSAFARLTTAWYRKAGPDSVRIYEKGGIGQCVETVTFHRGTAANRYRYDPVWIDEAVAQYMAAEVRAAMLPESIPKKSRTFKLTEQGAGETEVPPRYLIHSEEWPDHPGTSAGTEGIGMDLLIEKRPWILPQVKALSTGRLAIGAFHDNLRDGVGTELYTAITGRQPYTSWGGILEQIIDLDTK